LTDKMTILVFLDWYLPGHRAGGPIRSIAALVEALGDQFNFRIVTLDRDLGDKVAYSGVQVNQWQRVGKAEVFYASPHHLTFRFLRELLEDPRHDRIYMNSCYSVRFTLKPMLLLFLRLVPRKTVIVAPRGQFSPGALQIKWFKKFVFLQLVKWTRFYSNCVMQASSALEARHIRDVFDDIRISIASVPTVFVATDMLIHQTASLAVPDPRQDKEAGSLRILFLSRVSKMKNLDYALKCLHGLKGRVTFDIVGPAEDAAYWKACQAIIATLPSNVTVNYLGCVKHELVHQTMADHDVFFLPTRGENFGHVIIEALVAGLPVVISDQTPWSGLEALGVGWALPLAVPEGFTRALQTCVDLDAAAFQVRSSEAMAYGKGIADSDAILEQNLNLFTLSTAEHKGRLAPKGREA
jgi:glycosyltransferase involved in cell wall biosynthesis